jgi:hypothetical protein
MAPIQLGKLSVEIAVNNIDGFIHTLIDVPLKSGFWVTFTVKDERGKAESFPLVDKIHKIKLSETYPDALQAAAKMLMKTSLDGAGNDGQKSDRPR